MALEGLVTKAKSSFRRSLGRVVVPQVRGEAGSLARQRRSLSSAVDKHWQRCDSGCARGCSVAAYVRVGCGCGGREKRKGQGWRKCKAQQSGGFFRPLLDLASLSLTRALESASRLAQACLSGHQLLS